MTQIKTGGKDFLKPLIDECGFEALQAPPTEKQISYAAYLAKRMCVELPKQFTKSAYSDFISHWKPLVKQEDDAMNEPSSYRSAYWDCD